MNANELTALISECLRETDDHEFFLKLESVLRQQQAEIEDLNNENTDLRYLIATKLEQQDGISLNSMAHPITNTPEPSYEIDLDKLETIEIDLPSPEPVGWMYQRFGSDKWWACLGEPSDEIAGKKVSDKIPLYTHPVKELTDEETINIIQRLIASWSDGFRNYTYDSDEPEENKLRDDVFAILRKASEK